MVRLDNISTAGGVASCRFYPENSEMYGKLKIDITSGEIIELTEPDGGCPKTYIAHARSKLHKLSVNNEKMPDEAFAIWY